MGSSIDFLTNWQAHAEQYYHDVVLFAEEQWVCPNSGKLIVFEPQQLEFLRETLTRDANGKFPYATIIHSEPKKSGKSFLEALVEFWVGLTEPGMPEVYNLANDLEQSQGRSFAACKQVVKLNSVLNRECRAVGRKILLPDGGFLEALPNDYAGGAGANQVLTAWDELWAYTSENSTRLWEEFTPVPTRRNSIRWISTYAGFTGESALLEGIYKRVVRKKNRIHPVWEFYVEPDSRTFAFWSETPRMPWQTAEYYRQQKAELRPIAYERLHRNRWVASASAFIHPEQWDNLPMLPKRPIPPLPLLIGVDAAHKRDSTFVTALTPTDDGPTLVDYRVWAPTKGTPVIPEETAVPYILKLREMGYRIVAVYYDPNHFEAGARLLVKAGIRVHEFTQNPANLATASAALYDAIIFKRLRVFPCPELREHVLNADASEGPKGWKLLKRSETKKIDGAMALSFTLVAVDEMGKRAGFGLRATSQERA